MAISKFSNSSIANGFPKYQGFLAGRTRNVVKTNLKLWVDATEPNSYTGTGSTWYDISGNGKNGTLNSTTYDSGSGGSISFNGSSSTVSFGPLGLTPSQATVQFFTKVNSNNGNYNPWVSSASSGGDDYTSGFNVDMGSISSPSIDVINFEGVFKPGAVDWYPSSTAFGTWLNIAVTFVASGSIIVYVNGTAVYTGSASAGGTFSTERFQLGKRFAGTAGYLNGYIGSFMFYDRALTASEVAQNYNESKARFGL